MVKIKRLAKICTFGSISALTGASSGYRLLSDIAMRQVIM
jgi:hypothetical protein|tara:strand:+ start:451 stop:570 length:120 start_codon:yes stop_codon:yes gene_type:complete